MDLDDAFANGAYIDGSDAFPPMWEAKAAAFRASTRCELDLPYGEGPRQVFDLFHPDRLARGTLIFVHGGYWKAFDKSVWSHLAAGAVSRGWSVAMPSYDLCPDVRISAITRQILQAVTTIAQRSQGPISLAGHSAGGQLVARMLDPALHLSCRDRIVAVLPISPVADLRPLVMTKMNDVLRLDADEAAAESPLLQPAPRVPVTVWVGAQERPVFREQAQALAKAWDCDHVEAPDRHHFDVIADLEDPESAMLRAVLPQTA